MILRSIRVENWRCFVNPIEIGPLADGLNIINAPNATGKSTLFEALLRGLLDGHRVTGQDIDAVRPWGRALAPTVTVEFAHGGTDYRLTKRFLDHATSVLERKESGRYTRVAEGEAADTDVRSIISGNPPGRGLARVENWGIAQVLWAPQGNLALKQLSRDLVDGIRTSLGVQISGCGSEPVEVRIDELHSQFFSQKRGKLKQAAPLSVLREKLKSATQRRDEAAGPQRAFDEAARRVEELRARRVQARRDAEELSRALRDARVQAEAYAHLMAEQKQRQANAQTAEAQHRELRQRIDAVERTASDLAEAKKAVADLQTKVPLTAREAEERDRDAARARAALEDARKGRQEVEEAEQQATLALRFVDCKAKTDELRALAEKVTRAQDAVVLHKATRGKLLAPDVKTIRAIRKAIKERDEARLRIEAALVTLEIVPEKDGSLVVLAGEETAERKTRARTPTQVKGSPEVVVDIPGIARLRAWGPTVSVEEQRKELARAERQIAGLTEPFGTAEIDGLEGLSEKAKSLDEKVAEAETQLETLFSGRSLEDIQKEQAKLSSALMKIVEQYPTWQKSAPDCETLRERAEETKRAFITRVEGAEADWLKAQAALTAVTKQHATLIERLDGIQARIRSLEADLAELTSDGKSQADRQTDLGRLALAWDAARVSLDQIAESLKAFADDPGFAVSRLEKQITAAEEAAQKAFGHEKTEEGRLTQLAAGGPYSVLAIAEEDMEHVQRELAAEELRMAGIELLHEMLTQRRTEVMAAIASPVETAATRIFHRIAGGRPGSIRIGESFEPCGVLPEHVEGAVGLDNISGGEQEQLHLATRLALAEVLAKEERQLVVLDDVLTATDAGRFARVMTILEEAAQRLQILILTCHPERYRGLEMAQFIDLESITREQAAQNG